LWVPAKATAVELQEGLIVADKFRLVRELGRGGMGSVWLADHMALDIPCAVKFVDKEQAESRPDARVRFEREAKAAAQLRSPHVVQILDHGVWQGIPYIAMEYLEGEDLAHRLERNGRLPYDEILRIVSQVARALSKAHAAGIVHRDLKPENIFLTRDEEGEIAKVLDFGIAKRSTMALGDSGTKTGSLLGTPFYMSPEQAGGVKGIDYRSDLFSLSTIVFQCVTGHLPFYSEGLGEILGKIMYEALPVPSATASVPPGFDAWWAKAAARRPVERYQSVKELVDSLARVLGMDGTLEIPALAPRVPPLGMPDVAAFTSQAPEAEPMQAPTMALGTMSANLEPVARTFEPEPMNGKRRKVVIGSAATLAGLAIGAFIAVRAVRTHPVQPAAPVARSATVVAVPEPPAVPPAAAPAPSASAAPAPSAEPTVAAPSAAKHEKPGPAVQPRPAKKTSPGPTAPGRRDFGI
jgi:serine/threonine protein kinase